MNERRLLNERSEKYLKMIKTKQLPTKTTWERLGDVMTKFQPEGFSLGDPQTRRILKLISMIVASKFQPFSQRRRLTSSL